MLFLGAVGKSAQIPLYMWLPDAMEGPTPVSALIHAATMVTAGVYLMARSAPILHFSPSTQWVIASIGAATALFAATIACGQDDIKRVLAYSTISQLGYMFLGEGSGDYGAGIFHTVMHAFFKALLFLSRRGGHPRPARRAEHEADGRPLEIPADHPLGVPHRLPGPGRHSAVRRLLVQGRHPGGGLAQEPGPVGRRRGHRRAHRLLHEPPGDAGLRRPGPLGGAQRRPRGGRDRRARAARRRPRGGTVDAARGARGS